MILQYLADIFSLATNRVMPFAPPVLEEVIK
jgi:hypothetical protein